MIVEPAGGRWLWRTPPWLCSPGGRPVVAVVVRAACVVRRAACVVRVVGVLVVVLVRVRRGRARPRRHARARCARRRRRRLAEQHPAADATIEIAAIDRRRAHDEVRRQDALRPDDQRGEDEDPDRVRQR